MKRWFISTTHFSHYSGRPYESVEEMNKGLINRGQACKSDPDYDPDYLDVQVTKKLSKNISEQILQGVSI